MSNGFKTRLILNTPRQPNNWLVIYNTGHEVEIDPDRIVINSLLEEGYTVWILDMPLIGRDIQPVIVKLSRMRVFKNKYLIDLRTVL